MGQRIKVYEKDFSPAREALEQADLILFCYPVYTFLAPYQLHRFIELVKADGISLEGKFASQITTSKHFYDVTAHRYIEENCFDLGMKVIRGLSADMEDLLSEKGQKEAELFFEQLISIPAVQKKMKGQLSDYIIAPYQKIIEQAKQRKE